MMEEQEPAQHYEEPASPAAAPAGPRRQRFGALAWSALILGIVGVVVFAVIAQGVGVGT
jgi:hypothetical protein